MPILNLFSKRQKALRGDQPDVYSYDSIPSPLRVQIVHILADALGGEYEYQYPRYGTAGAYEYIVNILCREYGVFELSKPDYEYHRRDYRVELTQFLLQESNHERVLDAVEVSFSYIDRHTRMIEFLNRRNASEKADQAIQEVNHRLREQGVGYRFEEGEVIRVDSEFLHSHSVKPALFLLRATEYAGAQEEFLKAHEHYRHGQLKEALVESPCVRLLVALIGSEPWGR